MSHPGELDDQVCFTGQRFRLTVRYPDIAMRDWTWALRILDPRTRAVLATSEGEVVTAADDDEDDLDLVLEPAATRALLPVGETRFERLIHVVRDPGGDDEVETQGRLVVQKGGAL